MKNLLLISLFLNLALAAALILRVPPSTSDPENPRNTESRLPPLQTTINQPSAGETGPYSPQPMAMPSSLDALSHAEQVAALIEHGWEADDAKVFLLGRALRERQKWLLENPPVANPDVYWRRRQDLPLDEERRQTAKKRSQQVEEAMAALFDTSRLRSPYGLTPELPFSEKKRNALIAWDQDYQALSQQIQADAFGFLLPEDREALALLEEEKQRDLETILSQEELFEYQLRTSETAVKLRRNLDAIEPTEQEFRTIYQLQHEVDQLRAKQDDNEFNEAYRVYQETTETLNNQLREILGEDRFRLYERSQDYSYDRLIALTKRLQLPRERVDAVFDIKDYALAEHDALRSAKALSDEDRQTELQALQNEVRAEVQKLLGEKGAELYEQQAGGHWLNRLN